LRWATYLPESQPSPVIDHGPGLALVLELITTTRSAGSRSKQSGTTASRSWTVPNGQSCKSLYRLLPKEIHRPCVRTTEFSGGPISDRCCGGAAPTPHRTVAIALFFGGWEACEDFMLSRANANVGHALTTSQPIPMSSIMDRTSRSYSGFITITRSGGFCNRLSGPTICCPMRGTK
jgi:hypothetical protein